MRARSTFLALAFAVAGTMSALPAHSAPPAWQIVPSPVASAGLAATSFTSSSDGWAVGSRSGLDTLTEHWNGSNWSVVPSPAVDFSDEALTGVSAVSPTDAWGVGWQDPYGTVRVHGLFTHWDGHAWSVVNAPAGIPVGVGARTASDIWAVGNDFYAHYDGQSWTAAPTPAANTHPAAVVTLAANDAWAVGGRSDQASGYRHDVPYLAHWNGAAWSSVTVPGNLGSGRLTAVTAINPSDIWAVGSLGSFPATVVALHYDGTSWHVMSGGGNQRGWLSGITAVSTNDVWAVGQRDGTLPNGNAVLRTLTAHWNGSTWSVVPSPSDSDSDNFLAAAAAVGNTVWAVGGDGGTLVERHN